MKLVTFNDGQVGRIADDQVIELDVASAREFFERDKQVRETGRQIGRAHV